MDIIQSILREEIEKINVQELRDNKPRFSIRFIKNHPLLFIGMYLAYFATVAVMLDSRSLYDFVWLFTLIFLALNLFFFFDIHPRYRYEDIDVMDLRVCFNGEWYNTREVPETVINRILQSNAVPDSIKHTLTELQKKKSTLCFYDIYRFTLLSHSTVDSVTPTASVSKTQSVSEQRA